MKIEFLNLLKPPLEGDQGRKKKNRGHKPHQATIYIYTWKYNKEISQVATLIKQECHLFFFLLQNQGKGGQNRSCLGICTSRSGEEVGKGHGKVNMVQILCAHVCKWKNETY
jgi:hypothetical protein